MIGTWPPVSRSRARIADARLQAAHLRHLDVHQDQIEPLRAARRDGVAAVADHRDAMAALIQQGEEQLLIGQVVLGNQHAERARPGPAAAAGFAVRGGCVGAGDPNSVTMASIRLDCLTGLDNCASKRAAVDDAGERPSPAEVRRITLVAASRSSSAISLASVKPSTSGIIASVRTRSNGSRCSAASASADRAAIALSTAVARNFQPARISVRIRRLVALSSTISTRRYGRLPACGTSGSVETGARPKWARKWNRLPFPTSLSIQIRPPISSTSCAEMVSPRPVPP